MRRIGSRIHEALKKWRRQSKQLELFRFRQRWAQKFGEYECLGGPSDGEMLACRPHGLKTARGGYYQVDDGDCRLHWRVSSRRDAPMRQ